MGLFENRGFSKNNFFFFSFSHDEAEREPGWPDLANFRPIGDCLLRAFFKLTELAHIFGATFFRS
jgi:hypothetical protein